ncbi:hypothetical protein H2200_009804 [Cladophialophora chaetospira]|uniref:BTB domain-containing protein n=1 Tax=Cladophialophora chaetospira TaxID=386627 RepID=A0AA38X371_9EURO|nr:hypothetical protein H2200_009804 [Cladophialophora chaetospira]
MAAEEVRPPNYLALLESGQYSDFIIECQGIEFKVHRAIVCPQSTMLSKAINGPFKEAEEGRINLTEEDPEILSRVLCYLYTSDYDAASVPGFSSKAHQTSKYLSLTSDSNTTLPGNVNELMVHILVFRYSDMLGIEPLKILSAKRTVDGAGLLLHETTFAKPLRLMYESTRSDDLYVRLPVTVMCASNRALESFVDTVDVIKAHEPIAWYLGMTMLRMSQASAQALKEEVLKEVLSQVNNARFCQAEHDEGAPCIPGYYKLKTDGTVGAYCNTTCADRCRPQ